MACPLPIKSGSGHATCSIEALNNGAVDGEARAPEFPAVRAGDEAVLDEGEDLELLAHLASVAFADCVCRPFEQLGIPRRAVVQSIRWNASDDIIRPEAIGQIRRETLPLRIGAILRSVGRDKDTLDGAAEGVVTAQVDRRHQRS